MRRNRILLALAVAVVSSSLAAPVASQFRRPPRPPQLVGMDALRAEFIAASGSDTVMFGGSSVILGVPAKTILAAQARWLRRHPEIVVSIEGHAEAADTRDHALAIGARRAEEVRDFLILLGVPAAQLTATSWGKERVAISGNNPTAFAANRRVQTVLVR
ncbi:MAG: OmpA family protein [Sphingomicrobium sp.]